MRLLKMCPRCLGDMTVDEILADDDSRCRMCGYRSSAGPRPAGLARNQSPASISLRQRNWPYASHYLRPDRPHVIA
jgi:DNA-directed RNA polymerase subunit RPC12/RpoP